MEIKNEKTYLGFWLYIMSDCVLFAGLFATFAVLRGETFGAPPIGAIVNLPYVLAETMLLLTSSFMMGLATLAAYREKKGLALALLAVTLLFGLSFLGMELYEFRNLVLDGHSWQASASLSSYFALVGTHGLHVAVASLWMLVLMIYVGMRGLTPGNLRKLVSLGLFWHFLDIVWIFIFTFVYLQSSL